MQKGHIDDIVDLQAYPISNPNSPEWHACVKRVRSGLSTNGCSVLERFVRPDVLEQLRDESSSVAAFAYRKTETVNAYNIALDTELPVEHPGRIQFERGNAFVARDQIPKDHVIERLYTSHEFQTFVASCCEIPAVYPMADALAGLVVNVLDPGRAHPWHFDTNAYTVSLLTQKADAGGEFEYSPNIRTACNESFADVRDILTGQHGPKKLRLDLEPGDLQLFKGRYSLHRVSPVIGKRARHTAIFAYCEQPGVIGSVERTRQLFGRIMPQHEAAESDAVRCDELLD